jgi:hypothetical protein
MKFSTETLHIMPSKNYAFCKTWKGEKYNLLKGVNKNFATFSMFLVRLGYNLVNELRTEIYRMTLSFLYILRSGSYTLRRDVNAFPSLRHTFPQFNLQFTITELHTLTLNIRSLHANRHREVRTFLMDVNKIIFTRVPWNRVKCWK